MVAPDVVEHLCNTVAGDAAVPEQCCHGGALVCLQTIDPVHRWRLVAEAEDVGRYPASYIRPAIASPCSESSWNWVANQLILLPAESCSPR